MKINKLFLFIFILICINASSQSIFQATYGGVSSDVSQDGCETSDGGYIITGYTTSYGTGGIDVFLVKTNSMGGIIWTKTFGGINDDMSYSIQQTNDGGYIIAGKTNSFGSGNYDCYLIKTDINGDLLWSKTYGGTSNDITNTVHQTADGGYVLSGYSNSFGSGDEDVYLVKTDSTGTVQWSFNYGAAGQQENAEDIKQTVDHGYILTGFVSGGFSTSNILVVKVDSTGVLQWFKTYGGSQDFSNSIEQTNDRGYTMTGVSHPSTGGNIFLLKTDSLGTVIWTKQLSNIGSANTIKKANGGYIISATANISPYPSKAACLIQTDSTGIIQWCKTYGGTNYEGSSTVSKTIDNGYILIGNWNSSSYSDFYLIKTDSIGNSGCNQSTISKTSIPGPNETVGINITSMAVTTITSPALSSSVTGGTENILCYVGIEEKYLKKEEIIVYPNPAKQKIHFLNLEKESAIEIYDYMGNLIFSSFSFENGQPLDLSGKEKGIYFYRITNKNAEITCGKFIFQPN